MSIGKPKSLIDLLHVIHSTLCFTIKDLLETFTPMHMHS
jgi:hypothetical protein